jgi:hypothetical protein
VHLAIFYCYWQAKRTTSPIALLIDEVEGVGRRSWIGAYRRFSLHYSWALAYNCTSQRLAFRLCLRSLYSFPIHSNNAITSAHVPVELPFKLALAGSPAHSPTVNDYSLASCGVIVHTSFSSSTGHATGYPVL